MPALQLFCVFDLYNLAAQQLIRTQYYCVPTNHLQWAVFSRHESKVTSSEGIGGNSA